MQLSDFQISTHPKMLNFFFVFDARNGCIYMMQSRLQKQYVVLQKQHSEENLTYTRKLYLGVPYA